MRNWLLAAAANAGVLGEIFTYLWQNKLWWMIPMVAVVMTVGLLLAFAGSSGLGPFIYTLF
jgi:hypothetical protein